MNYCKTGNCRPPCLQSSDLHSTVKLRASLQSRQDYRRYDSYVKEFPQLLLTYPVRLEEPRPINGLSKDVFQRRYSFATK